MWPRLPDICPTSNWTEIAGLYSDLDATSQSAYNEFTSQTCVNALSGLSCADPAYGFQMYNGSEFYIGSLPPSGTDPVTDLPGEIAAPLQATTVWQFNTAFPPATAVAASAPAGSGGSGGSAAASSSTPASSGGSTGGSGTASSTASTSHTASTGASTSATARLTGKLLLSSAILAFVAFIVMLLL